ncbi:MAG: M60 family metallopeptidase [Ruminococcus sp.]|nr:M60 family metallopeptidase [Ruminococcus sp.]
MKKRSFKRNAAFLLALSIVSSLPQTMNAEAIVANIGTQKNRTPVLTVNKRTSDIESNAIGKIDVYLSSALELANEVDFTATLTDANGNSQTGTFSIKNIDEQKVSFSGLADGDYTLEVGAPGFVAFSQTINVAQNLSSVKLTAGFHNGYNYEGNNLHPGVIMVGDVNNDGLVNDDDKNILVDKIDGADVDGSYVTDLNNDGTTDLTDLTIFSNSYNRGEVNTQASVTISVSPDAITATVSENTTCEGSIEDVLNGEGSVSLGTANGEAISEENPVEVEFDFSKDGKEAIVDGVTLGTGDAPIEKAVIGVTYTDENGEERTEDVPFEADTSFLLKESNARAVMDANGNINVFLGAQIAVKKVSIKITAMQESEGNNNLAEISKVEFVNGMEERIPEPELDIPENLSAKAGSEKFELTWSPCMNVKGYQVKIQYNGKTYVKKTDTNSMSISETFSDDNNQKLEIKNYETYIVSVQSVNGTWQSGYCYNVDVTPQPSKKPDKPDNVKATGIFKGVKVGWSKMDDTLSYSVFYKRNDEDSYTEIPNIKGTSYTIENLGNLTDYEVYVVGHNHLGSSPQSLHATATTTDLDLADMPKYNVINRDENGKIGASHIVSVTRSGGGMFDSPLDEGKSNTAWGVVDGDKSSYYSKAVNYDGGWNWLGDDQGIKYTFDKEYKIDTIGLLTVNTDISFTHFRWWDDAGNEGSINGSWDYTNYASRTTDSKGRPYYIIKLPQPITASKIQIGTGRYSSPNTVSEVYFYRYDTLMDEVMDLYIDDLHTVLKEEVTQETIDALRVRIEAPDEFGEINPNKAAQLRELETAEKILKAQALSPAVEIYSSINTKDVGRGFGGLNAWQPLGISLGVGQEVTVYVGSKTKKTGEDSGLRLISTQYHSEAGGVSPEGCNLKVGANTFKLSVGNLGSQENGGALYVQYQGNNLNEKFSIRVTGGTEIPRLDLYKVTDEAERKARAVAFIQKLDEYVPTIEDRHNELHQNSTNKKIKFDYDEANCILGASDIMLDTMMISLPAKQIKAGTGSGTVEQRAEKLLKSMKAMEDMMYLFYQHKGLNASAPDAINQVPNQHLNIRYQRMFSGAFMYASGNHIGIEWGSVTGIVNGNPIVSDEEGRYVSGNYFGWGVAHEIGHCINQGDYAVAEITNNYFAQLAQAQDKNEGMRFQYQNIYNKVSSGTKGDCSNIATQLGMYWQLHLAYDKGLNYKTYSDYNEQKANLFYARVDTYSRNPEAAPKPGGVKLTLDGGSDQKLMRLACAAAEKNVLEFFERWGKTPDSTTREYAEQFAKETRAIFYANDDSRVYALKGAGSVLGTDCSVKAIENVSVKIGKAANKVDLSFTSTGIPESDILGYEIVRCTISGGKVEETPVGFSTESTFTDTVSTMNNRAVFYKVTLIDQYLNRSAEFKTDMVKIEHDGSMDKTNWTIRTTNLTAETVSHDATEEMPCDKTHENPAQQAIDSNLNTVYTPRVNGNNAEIIIDFNQTLTTTGLKYTAGTGTSVGQYEVYVMTNGQWKLTAEGSFNGSETVYFANEDSQYVSTYAATSVKLVLLNQDGVNISISELDVLGVTGDNVDFRRTEGEKVTVIGTLSEDYQYGQNADDVIPKDSLVFTGSYKGNPAYNVVLLYDENGKVVGGRDSDGDLASQQIILADVPDKGNIANVSDGTWIYWIEPDQMANMNMPEKVRVELYRVNNAKNNEGQRLVSDSLFEEVPETLNNITFGK